MICIIAAIGEGGVIGSKQGLPWNIPDEYNQFLDQVRGNTIIMGRKSWEIFGADLPETRFIVISSSFQEIPGALAASSVEQAVNLAETFPEKVFIAGGGSIYKEGLKYANRMHLSFIKGKYQGNVFFPEFSKNEWVEEKSENHPEYIYTEYVRRI